MRFSRAACSRPLKEASFKWVGFEEREEIGMCWTRVGPGDSLRQASQDFAGKASEARRATPSMITCVITSAISPDDTVVSS